ncbi:hypothetical protein HDU76_010829, partial [Blyttiomyces sp. JEL0837]
TSGSYLGFDHNTYYIDVQFAVKNKAYVKDVGVRITTDGGANYFEDLKAHFNATLGGEYELWTLNIDRGTYWTNDPITKEEYELAAYVSYNNGPRSYDPNNNYYVYHKATQQNPIVHLDGDNLVLDSKTNVISLTGSARAHAFDKKKDWANGAVQIHWSSDNWKTIQDTPAIPHPDTKTWTWNFGIADPKLIPKNITYAIHYISSAGSFWDNNAKGSEPNFTLDIAPYCSIESLPAKTTANTGLITVYAGCYSEYFNDLSSASEFRIDGNLFTSAGAADQYNINTTALANGEHTAEVRLLFPGTNAVFGSLKRVFSVDNTV